MNLQNLETDRLILIPITLEITSSLTAGNSGEVEKFGIRTHSDWPTEDTKDILPFINRTLEEQKLPSGFEFWMITEKESMEVIGDIGFHGRPDEKGQVEIGYGLVEEKRGRGYGFEAARAIMDWTIAHEQVRLIKADCLIDNIPSIRILEKLNMKEINRDDKFIYWELRKF